MSSSAALARADGPRVAIVHDWLTNPGGSEKVVVRLLRLFPDAEIFTSVYDPAPWPAAITSRPVHASFLNRVPRATRIYPRLLPFMNAAFESFDLSGFDLVVSSSHSCAKNVLTRVGTLHVCYCHTPMRHAWEPSFLEGEEIGRVSRLVAQSMLGRLRREDALGALRPDQFVANSTYVADRIWKYYRRDARVIHPPVDVGPLLDRPRDTQDYYLCLGRLVPYKRADLAVAACERLGRRLKVVGDGRWLEHVSASAGPFTEVLGRRSDAEIRDLLAGARALLFPGDEDFGIVPVEAQAAGVPVIAYGSGGVLDTVVDGVTGLLFEEQSVDGVVAAIEAFEGMSFDDAALRRHAGTFAPERFDEAFLGLIDELTPARAKA